jgi:hypothetical protein
MSEFYRVVVEKSKIYKSIVLDLSRAHNDDIDDKDKRITELESQITDYKQDLIDALQDVTLYAPPCTSTIEYAEKRLKELTEPIK